MAVVSTCQTFSAPSDSLANSSKSMRAVQNTANIFETVCYRLLNQYLKKAWKIWLLLAKTQLYFDKIANRIPELRIMQFR